MVDLRGFFVFAMISFSTAGYSAERVSKSLSFQGTEVSGMVTQDQPVSRKEKLRRIQKKQRQEYNDLRMRQALEMDQLRENSANLQGVGYLAKLQEISGRHHDEEDELSRKQERELCDQVGISCEPQARSQVTSVQTTNLD